MSAAIERAAEALCRACVEDTNYLVEDDFDKAVRIVVEFLLDDETNLANEVLLRTAYAMQSSWEPPHDERVIRTALSALRRYWLEEQ